MKKQQASCQRAPGLCEASSSAIDRSKLRLKCPPAVVLRPETFGGMAFHRKRGITLELDSDAFALLQTFRQPRSQHELSDDVATGAVVGQLVKLGFLTPVDGSGDSLSNQMPGTSKAPVISPPGGVGARPVVTTSVVKAEGGALSAPEIVHLAITARCSLGCPGCYVPRSSVEPEMSTKELCHLIDQWAEMRVFQLAVGGGEPLLRDDLVEVLAYASRKGIAPNLTTNGMLLTAEVVRRLEAAGVRQVNVSLNGPTYDVAIQYGRTAAALRALRLLLASSLAVGVNLLVTSVSLSGLSHTLSRLHALGVRRVTVLRPKPGADASWYTANRLRRNDLVHLRATLTAWQGMLELEVGSALVCLMGDVPPQILRRGAVHGCAAGRRICTIWPDGRVTPCSFLAHLCAGSVREEAFATLWQRGQGWRELRDPTLLPGGRCRGCRIASLCGGSRCLAWHEQGNLSAGDAECPR